MDAKTSGKPEIVGWDLTHRTAVYALDAAHKLRLPCLTTAAVVTLRARTSRIGMASRGKAAR